MHQIEVSLVYATEQKQHRFEAKVKRGTSALDLIVKAGFMSNISAWVGTPLEDLKIGVYGQKVAHDHLLEEGDRVEIYRPLLADPKEVRRQLALLGKTMGKKIGD
jgi:putative ubiquitin-RnfH superfamily antitoxin RatB of RatAB toxin-antitoxin module